MSPIFREFLSIARAQTPLSATELLNAWAELDILRAKTLEEMRDFSVLLCPVASIPAFRPGEREWIIDGRPWRTLTLCARRNGSTRSPRRQPWFPWDARRRIYRSECRLSRAPSKTKRRLELQPSLIERSAFSRLRWRLVKLFVREHVRATSSHGHTEFHDLTNPFRIRRPRRAVSTLRWRRNRPRRATLTLPLVMEAGLERPGCAKAGENDLPRPPMS